MRAPKNEMIIDFDNAASKATLWATFRRLGGRQRIAITRYRKRRSSNFNAYYWAVVVRHFREFLNVENGQAVTDEEAHDLMRAKFLRVTTFDPRTHEPIGVTLRSSASLTTDEFSAYVEQCVAWLADQFDIVCPAPGELACV